MIAANSAANGQSWTTWRSTPNHVHYDPAMKAIKAGLAVMCEKPLCLNLKEAGDLVKAVRKHNVPFAVAHTYLGHWTPRFSRYVVRAGLLGEVRWVDSYYLQGWLATKLEATGQMQAAWRTNPKLAGGSGCGGDIGTHALMQLRYVTGLEVSGFPHSSRPLLKAAHWMIILPCMSLEQRCQSPGACLAKFRSGTRTILASRSSGPKARYAGVQEEPESITVHLASQPDRFIGVVQ